MSLQQQIEYALRDGIIDKNKHKILIAEPYRIGQVYNINPYYFFKHSADVLNANEQKFMLNLAKYSRLYKGVVYISQASTIEKFRMMAAITVRNFKNGYYYSVDDLVDYLSLDYDNKFVFNEGYMFITQCDLLQKHENKYVFSNFLNFMQERDICPILHFSDIHMLPLCLSEYWSRTSLVSYYIAEVE